MFIICVDLFCSANRLPNATRFNELLKRFIASETGKYFAEDLNFAHDGTIQVKHLHQAEHTCMQNSLYM